MGVSKEGRHSCVYVATMWDHRKDLSLSSSRDPARQRLLASFSGWELEIQGYMSFLFGHSRWYLTVLPGLLCGWSLFLSIHSPLFHVFRFSPLETPKFEPWTSELCLGIAHLHTSEHYTETDTHTHINTHKTEHRTYICRHIHTSIYTYTQRHKHKLIHTNTHKNAHSATHKYTQTHTYTHWEVNITYTHTDTHINTLIHSYTYTHRNTHTHTHIHQTDRHTETLRHRHTSRHTNSPTYPPTPVMALKAGKVET